jgi:hypothetical protein
VAAAFGFNMQVNAVPERVNVALGVFGMFAWRRPILPMVEKKQLAIGSRDIV